MVLVTTLYCVNANYLLEGYEASTFSTRES
jgi:hypothetical protein